MRTVEWDATHQQVRMIDQRVLPAELRAVAFTGHRQVAEAIRAMVVRGAPAIGAAAAFGLALAALESPADKVPVLLGDLQNAAGVLQAARPTAANLKWALERLLRLARQGHYPTVDDLRAALISAAQRIADEDVILNQRMAHFGAALIGEGEIILHHCNTGALATVDWGTALGVIRLAHEQGKHPHVLVDETRPRLQGSRLTAWELEQYGISYEIITDNAAGYFLRRGEVHKVMVGADRVAANGDVANKIGTYMLALAARDNAVPFYVVVPTSTIDLSLPNGAAIPIEERDPGEVLALQIDGAPVAPRTARARNPAFDITPASLITGLITENGIVYPPYLENLTQVVLRPPESSGDAQKSDE